MDPSEGHEDDHNNDEHINHHEFDDDYEIDDDDDDENELDSTSDGFADINVNNDRLPLVPSEYSTLDEALQNFVAVFESRYGPLHPFTYLSTLQESLTEAFEAPGRDMNERKPLAIYLHNDNSVACNIFAQQVMCSETISPLLKAQFVTWGWDVTYAENKTRLIDWFEMLNLNEVAHQLRHIRRENYPVLMVLIKDRGNVMPITMATGHDSPDAVLEKLMQGLDTYVNVKNRALGEERARVEREDLRAKQVAEYEESKAMDKAKQEERERLIREEREAEEARQREEEAALARQERLKESVPSEPAATEKNIITIRLRFPTGDQQIRRFRMNEQVKWLVTYVEAHGFDMKTYRLFTSDVPKKDVATLDNNKTFAELKWPARENITIDEK
jgi:DNA-binding response OmpR family regulator